MIAVSLKLALVGVTVFLLPTLVSASTGEFQFNATLDTGTLAGTSFSGTGSFDRQGMTGSGEEFLTLTALDFVLDGASFTKADIDQGGQVILEDGVLSSFTAAFFPPPPDNTSLGNLAFGFGGPRVIGYSTLPGPDFGSGNFTMVNVPEPNLFALYLLAIPTLRALGRFNLRRR
jgi:hypothetical protein